MIYCPKCGKENAEDAYFCSKCGFPLDENPENYNEKEDKSKQKRSKNKSKTKTKSKTRTKVKYKDKGSDKQTGKMSFFQSFMMFFFILLSITALAGCSLLGYYVYQNQNIVVPDVTGYTYEDAESTLKEAKLQVEKVTQITEDESEVGIILKQNKKAGSKVMENTVIKLTVGIEDTKVTVPDVEGKTLTEAVSLLNKNNIKYEITYEEDDTNDIVLSQSIKAGKKIEEGQTVTITVSKKKETVVAPEEPEENTNNQNTPEEN